MLDISIFTLHWYWYFIDYFLLSHYYFAIFITIYFCLILLTYFRHWYWLFLIAVISLHAILFLLLMQHNNTILFFSFDYMLHLFLMPLMPFSSRMLMRCYADAPFLHMIFDALIARDMIRFLPFLSFSFTIFAFDYIFSLSALLIYCLLLLLYYYYFSLFDTLLFHYCFELTFRLSLFHWYYYLILILFAYCHLLSLPFHFLHTFYWCFRAFIALRLFHLFLIILHYAIIVDFRHFSSIIVAFRHIYYCYAADLCRKDAIAASLFHLPPDAATPFWCRLRHFISPFWYYWLLFIYPLIWLITGWWLLWYLAFWYHWGSCHYYIAFIDCHLSLILTLHCYIVAFTYYLRPLIFISLIADITIAIIGFDYFLLISFHWH